MLEIDPVARDDLAGGADIAADDLESVLDLAGAAAGLAPPVMLGLEERGAFFTASDTDARGRAAAVAEGALPDPIEPVGDATALRAGTFSPDGFEFADTDKDGLERGAAPGFVGTIEALRVAVAGAGAGLEDIEDDNGVLVEVVGADVVGFFSGGAVTLLVAGAAAGALAPEGFTEPAPNVPELMIYRTINFISLNTVHVARRSPFSLLGLVGRHLPSQ